jgi:hypothetical protein
MDDNDPSRWCPWSQKVAGDFLPTVEQWPSPENAARTTHQNEIQRNLDLISAFDPTCECVTMESCGLVFHPDYRWLMSYRDALLRRDDP